MRLVLELTEEYADDACNAGLPGAIAALLQLAATDTTDRDHYLEDPSELTVAGRMVARYWIEDYAPTKGHP